MLDLSTVVLDQTKVVHVLRIANQYVLEAEVMLRNGQTKVAVVHEVEVEIQHVPIIREMEAMLQKDQEVAVMFRNVVEADPKVVLQIDLEVEAMPQNGQIKVAVVQEVVLQNVLEVVVMLRNDQTKVVVVPEVEVVAQNDQEVAAMLQNDPIEVEVDPKVVDRIDLAVEVTPQKGIF